MLRKIVPFTLLVALSLLASPALAAPAGHVEGYVPVVAHGGGLFNSFWSTDVWIYRQGATRVDLWYNPSGNDNSNAQSLVVQLTDPVTYLPDIVANTFHTSGKGSLHYLADGQVVVLSRTWTPGPNGGTYGFDPYGMPASMASMPNAGPDGALRMMVNESDGFRSNLGLVNVTPSAVTVSVDIFTANGQPAPGSSSFTVALQPYDMQQIDDILSRLGPGTRNGLTVRVAVAQGNGAVLAYIAEVDNTTNSGNYEEGFRFGY